MEEQTQIPGRPAEGTVPDRELKIADVATFVGLSQVQVYAAIERGDLAKVPNRRPMRVMLSEALRFKDNPPKPGRKPRQRSDSNGQAQQQ